MYAATVGNEKPDIFKEEEEVFIQVVRAFQATYRTQAAAVLGAGDLCPGVLIMSQCKPKQLRMITPIINCKKIQTSV